MSLKYYARNMSDVIVKQFIPLDAKIMSFRDQNEYQCILAVCPYYFENLLEMCEGNAFSVFKNGEIICITGWAPPIQNFCEIWFFASENLNEKFNKDVYNAFKMILNKAKSEWERIQTTCKENKRNKRFLEFLGFKQECLMRKYGFKGEDMYLYAWVKE
jgi:hypothetical protein